MILFTNKSKRWSIYTSFQMENYRLIKTIKLNSFYEMDKLLERNVYQKTENLIMNMFALVKDYF